MSARKRCERCLRPQSLCYCASLQPITNVWPVHILQHPVESRHALGTARIAHLGLTQCTLSISDHAILPDLDNAVLIYPGEGSRPLSELRNSPPCNLLFIDATWRKSRRMLRESPALAALPRHALDNPPQSRYRIRSEPFGSALSTLEAIVHTLGQLQGHDERYLSLLHIMDRLIDQQIACMAPGTFENNYLNCDDSNGNCRP